jgi:hypothetical protein
MISAQEAIDEFSRALLLGIQLAAKTAVYDLPKPISRRTFSIWLPNCYLNLGFTSTRSKIGKLFASIEPS